jgi:hypothetical protein
MPVKSACPCCGHLTLDGRNNYDICPVCFWEDDGTGDEPVLHPFHDEPTLQSPANKGMTLSEARANYASCSACEPSMVRNVRPPTEEEKGQSKR